MDNEETNQVAEEQEIKQEAPQDVAKEWQDKYLRLLAEMDNSRKRMQKDKQEMMRFAVENVLADVLGPMDNLENALKATQNLSAELQNWAKGFQMILAQFKEVLSQHGVTPYHSEGELFDAHKHEAVETVETEEHPEGIILQEFVRGYRCGDRIIRHARVKVAKAPSRETKNNEGE